MLAGMTWYTAETWLQVKASASDPERFENSFLQWEAMAMSALRELQRAGVRAVKFQIVPEEFAAWCILHDTVNNTESRSEFVSEMLSNTGKIKE